MRSHEHGLRSPPPTHSVSWSWQAPKPARLPAELGHMPPSAAQGAGPGAPGPQPPGLASSQGHEGPSPAQQRLPPSVAKDAGDRQAVPLLGCAAPRDPVSSTAHVRWADCTPNPLPPSAPGEQAGAPVDRGGWEHHEHSGHQEHSPSLRLVQTLSPPEARQARVLGGSAAGWRRGPLESTRRLLLSQEPLQAALPHGPASTARTLSCRRPGLFR